MNVIDLAKAHKWNLPTVCPKCGGELILSENHKQLYCGNTNCKSYIAGRLNKWTIVNNIKEFGTATIEKIAEKFDSINCIYKDEVYDWLKTLDGYGERSVAKMRKEIEDHKSMTLAKFIAGFNIEDIGEKVAQKIIDNVGAKKLSDLQNKDYNNFEGDGIRKLTAMKFANGMAALADDMNETLKYVTLIEEGGNEKVSGGNLEGMSFCFTGAMAHKRSDLEKMVVENGGTISGVNKKLTYLVQQDPNSTSGKSEKAKELGIKIISPEEFLKMISK